MPVTPYLFFDGRCEEALDFYKKALGAEIGMLMRFKECPDTPPADCVPADNNKIMHSAFQIGGTTVMASDGMAQGQSEIRRLRTVGQRQGRSRCRSHVRCALRDGGQVQMPLGKTFFAKRFGMVADKFGVSWMVIVEP